MNDIEELYKSIKKEVDNNLEVIRRDSEKSYVEYNNKFKEQYGITYDEYYDWLVEFYGEE